MTYTYNPSLADDVSLVRFHLGDNHDKGHYLEDEEIQYWVTATDVETAVLQCIKYIITQLSSPDFKKDWLQISYKEARAGFEKLLDEKEQEFGVKTGAISSSSVSLPWRADSHSTSTDAVDGAP